MSTVSIITVTKSVAHIFGCEVLANTMTSFTCIVIILYVAASLCAVRRLSCFHCV